MDSMFEETRRDRRWAMVPLVLGLLAAATVLADCAPARALEREATPLERAVAVDLAKYTANEAGLEGWADLVLLWQASETHGDTLRERRAWLRRHSRCVLAERPAHGRCQVWPRHLDASGRRPRGWPPGAAWEGRGRAMWLGLLAWSLRVVTGEIGWRPCPEPPDTWDGRRWRRSAVARGYVPLDCRDPATSRPTRNEGYEFPSHGSAR